MMMLAATVVRVRECSGLAMHKHRMGWEEQLRRRSVVAMLAVQDAPLCAPTAAGLLRRMMHEVHASGDAVGNVVQEGGVMAEWVDNCKLCWDELAAVLVGAGAGGVRGVWVGLELFSRASGALLSFHNSACSLRI